MTRQRKAWCHRCDLVEYVDDAWRCLWCRTVTLDTLHRERGATSRCFTQRQIRAMHETYAAGTSLATLARIHHAHVDTIRKAFWHLGLPTRSIHISNQLEGPRRRAGARQGALNGSYRRDVDNQLVAETYQRVGSIARTAQILGCGAATIHHRLVATGHPRNPVGTNQHPRSTTRSSNHARTTP